jgi:hypothetical protein
MRALKANVRDALMSLSLLCSLLAVPSAHAEELNTVVLSGASFHPRCSSIKFDTNGIRLRTLDYSDNPDCSPEMFLSPINLPNGSTMNFLRATIFQKNNKTNAYPVKLRLLRTDDKDLNSFKVVAELDFPAVTEMGKFTTQEPVYPAEAVFKGTKYAYFLQLELPYRKGVDRYFNDAAIDYTMPK